MAIDFPNSPTVGDTYITNGKQYRWDGTVWGIYGTFSPDSTASDTEPSGVGDGHIWYRSDQSQTLIRYDNTWVEVGSAGGFDSSSTSFPTSLDSGTGFAAVEALQAKVGVDSSAVTTSLDYKVAQLEAAATGKILQVVSTTKTDTFSSTTLSAWTDITGLSVSITPSSASSKVLVIAHVSGNIYHVNYAARHLRIARDSTGIAFADSAGNRQQATMTAHMSDANVPQGMSAVHLDSPSTTSATTYKVQFIAFDGTPIYINRSNSDTDAYYTGRTVSSITVMEVAG